MADYLQTGLSTFKDLFTWLSDRSKSKDITKNALLREIRDNLKMLEHRDKEGVNIKALIEGLSANAIADAYVKNYKFDEMSEGKKLLDKQFILNKRQEKYIGWDVARFIYSIEGKIKDLKNIPVLYADITKSPLNITVRLDNLYYQLLLLAIFISGKK
ncbi:MAG: hypothetical protein IPL12_09180 [Bacteroidetes bacterium]|nr:hypothetical protein [Bacteroidota bacterium]MBK8343456.1 hypothetical protein [Bacteroidota bacterium]